ncbi:MAG: dTDP-4-dehydrorhamnose 3,5-epimerase [Mariprofundales bacterium]
MILNIRKTKINGVVVVETKSVCDERGAFARLFCEKELAPVIEKRRIIQINHSCTTQIGAIRGLHFQYPPHAEMKMVRCLSGKVWDVAVDLRKSSPTFLQWHAEELEAKSMRMLIIPEGCAHGFQVLEKDSKLLYLHTAAYYPALEAGVSYDDPKLAIVWPLPVQDISQRDQQHALLDENYLGIKL